MWQSLESQLFFPFSTPNRPLLGCCCTTFSYFGWCVSPTYKTCPSPPPFRHRCRLVLSCVATCKNRLDPTWSSPRFLFLTTWAVEFASSSSSKTLAFNYNLCNDGFIEPFKPQSRRKETTKKTKKQQQQMLDTCETHLKGKERNGRHRKSGTSFSGSHPNCCRCRCAAVW